MNSMIMLFIFFILFFKDCGPGKSIPSAYTNWFCQHIDPSQRFETDGIPLPVINILFICYLFYFIEQNTCLLFFFFKEQQTFGYNACCYKSQFSCRKCGNTNFIWTGKFSLCIQYIRNFGNLSS